MEESDCDYNSSKQNDHNIKTAFNINLYNFPEETQNNLVYELSKYISLEEIQRIIPDFGKTKIIYESIVNKEDK